MFEKLKELSPYALEVFANFYSKVLKREHLSKFFTSEEQIVNLCSKQSKNILDSFGESEEELRERYSRLAELHIKLGLSYSDYIEAFNFLQAEFTKVLSREGRLQEQIEDLHAYFENIRHITAYGYQSALIKGNKSYFERLKQAKVEFKPLAYLYNQMEQDMKGIDIGQMEKQGYPCPVCEWIPSLEAKMMIPDKNIHEELINIHLQTHTIYDSLKYYIEKKLFIQSYQLLQLFINNVLFSTGKLENIYSSFNEERDERFLRLLRNSDEKDFVFAIKIDNLPLLTELYGKNFKISLTGKTKKNLEDRIPRNNFTIIFQNDEIIGFVKDMVVEELRGALEYLKKDIEQTEAGELLKLKIIAFNAMLCREHCYPENFEKVKTFIRGEAIDKALYILFTEGDIERIKDILYSEAQKNRYVLSILDKDRLDIFFQPVVDLRTDKIIDVEALIRLKENGKHVSAAYLFIDNLLEMGRITELDINVFKKILEYSNKLKDITNKVFINISPISLKSVEFRKYLKRAIMHFKDYDISPYIEIDEQAMLENIDIVKYLSSYYGIKFAMDNFGTGYSSLKTLADLAKAEAISHLKIDSSLTKSILESEEIYKIIKSISSMAKSLGLKTVAKFVENEKVVNMLKKIGIDCGQGFYYNPALHIDELMQKYQK